MLLLLISFLFSISLSFCVLFGIFVFDCIGNIAIATFSSLHMFVCVYFMETWEANSVILFKKLYAHNSCFIWSVLLCINVFLSQNLSISIECVYSSAYHWNSKMCETDKNKNRFIGHSIRSDWLGMFWLYMEFYWTIRNLCKLFRFVNVFGCMYVNTIHKMCVYVLLLFLVRSNFSVAVDFYSWYSKFK